MKKIVLETKVKIVDGDIENTVSQTQSVEEFTKAVELKELSIAANGNYTFSPSGNGVRGAKGIKIISDTAILLTSSQMMNNYSTGIYVKDITLFGGQDSNESNPTSYRDKDTLGYNGNIVLTNDRSEQEANVKIIWYY